MTWGTSSIRRIRWSAKSRSQYYGILGLCNAFGVMLSEIALHLAEQLRLSFAVLSPTKGDWNSQ